MSLHHPVRVVAAAAVATAVVAVAKARPSPLRLSASLGAALARSRAGAAVGPVELAALASCLSSGGARAVSAAIRLGAIREIDLSGWQGDGECEGEKPSAAVEPHAVESLLTPRVCSLLAGLEKLSLARTGLTRVPEGLRSLPLGRVRSIDIGGNSIAELPEWFVSSLARRARRLEVLNAAGNAISSVPESLGGISSLVLLGLRSNRLARLPESICALKNLKELYVTDNVLEALPESLGECSSLVKLQASHNRLTRLPASLGKLEHLELMRVACCHLEELHPAVLTAPKLAWLSLGGNPLAGPEAAPRPARRNPAAEKEEKEKEKEKGKSGDAATDEESVASAETPLGEAASGTSGASGLASPEVPLVAWSDVSVPSDAPTLGSGASGQVAQVAWGPTPAALKVFRSDASPDGRVADEVEIACEVEHARVPRTLARLESPPALLMEVAPGQPMALKPNHASLLRCRWDVQTRFSLPDALAVARDTADALKTFHSLGVAHGDVYAHNVLFSKTGKNDKNKEETNGVETDEEKEGQLEPASAPRATLMDFGAAFHYPPERSAEFQKPEVRAWALMLNDILDRVDEVECDEDVANEQRQRLEDLRDVVRRALAPDVQARPTFADVVERLA